MKKYQKSEGKLDVLRGEQAQVLNDHFSKTGKFAVSDFDDDERAELEADLDRFNDEGGSPPAESGGDE